MFRLIDTPPAPGAYNMAVDEALMQSVREGAGPVLRFYRWQPGCLSLGRNQPAVGIYDPERIADLGIDVVRRPTGGRAVLHRRELTYSVVVAEGVLGGLRESYLRINRALAAGLRRLGVTVDVMMESDSAAPVPSAEPCFRDPVVGEVVAGGRKLIGSAQVREGGVMLQHGSLLLHDDQAVLASIGLNPAAALTPPGAPATLSDFLDPLPDWEALTSALIAGWSSEFGAEPRPDALSAGESARVPGLLRKHQDLEWIWRR